MSEPTPTESVTTTTQPSYRVGVSTHPGKRDKNEDACATTETETCSVVVVADGAGGHAGGEVASEIVVSEVVAYFNANRSASPGPDLLRGALKAAQTAVRAEIGRTAKYHDMRSTALIVAATRTRAWVGHVGDSRAYLVRDGVARQLTRDDTLVQTLIEVGEIDAEQARTHSKANVLLQSIGDPRTLDYHIAEPIDVGPGDVMVACSDGLAETLRDGDIASMAAEGTGEEIAARMVKRAVESGVTDNVTVAVVRWQKSARRPTISTQGRVVKRRRRKRATTPFRVAVGALVVAAAVIGIVGVRRQRAVRPAVTGAAPAPQPSADPALPAGDSPVAEPVQPGAQPGPTLAALYADATTAAVLDPADANAAAAVAPDDSGSATPAANDDAGVAPSGATLDASAAVLGNSIAAAPAATTDAGAPPPSAAADASTGATTTAAAPSAEMGSLLLRGLPPDARVFVNQTEVRPDAHGMFAIPAGRRVLVRVHQHGKTDQNESVRVEPGGTASIRVELAPARPPAHEDSSAGHAPSEEHHGGSSTLPENPF